MPAVQGSDETAHILWYNQFAHTITIWYYSDYEHPPSWWEWV